MNDLSVVSSFFYKSFSNNCCEYSTIFSRLTKYESFKVTLKLPSDIIKLCFYGCNNIFSFCLLIIPGNGGKQIKGGYLLRYKSKYVQKHVMTCEKLLFEIL